MILLATSWGDQICGIAEHSKQLIAAVKGYTVQPCAGLLDPAQLGHYLQAFPDASLIHLNYHRALHSRWTSEEVAAVHSQCQLPVVITFHDTFGELEPDQLSKDLCATADAFIVHEPCCGLPQAKYWRMGVPTYQGVAAAPCATHSRMVLGTCGFDFPWKNYTELAKVTAAVGWGFLVCCPEMGVERWQELKALNPWFEVHTGESADMVIAYLKGCDATAFMYTCGNSGQSAAILQGIAARKPVYALSSCRQFRSLCLREPLAGIQWVSSFEDLQRRLLLDRWGRLDPYVVALAEQESWTVYGAKYAALYRELGA